MDGTRKTKTEKDVLSCSVPVPNAARNYLGSKIVNNIILLFVAR